MKKLLLLLSIFIGLKTSAQSIYQLQQDSIILGKTSPSASSSVTIPGVKLNLKGLPKGNISIRADGRVIHNDTVYVPSTAQITINGLAKLLSSNPVYNTTAVVEVGPDKQYTTLAAAYAAVDSNIIIRVYPGTYIAVASWTKPGIKVIGVTSPQFNPATKLWGANSVKITGKTTVTSAQGTEFHNIGFSTESVEDDNLVVLLSPYTVINNCIFKGKYASSLYHNLLFENRSHYSKVLNCSFYDNGHGLAIKSNDIIVDNFRSGNHVFDAIIVKSDNGYGNTNTSNRGTIINNFNIQATSPDSLVYGVLLQSFTTGTSVRYINVSNGYVLNAKYGVATFSIDAGGVGHCNLNNIASELGNLANFLISNAQNISMSNLKSSRAVTVGYSFSGSTNIQFMPTCTNVADASNTTGITTVFTPVSNQGYDVGTSSLSYKDIYSRDFKPTLGNFNTRFGSSGTVMGSLTSGSANIAYGYQAMNSATSSSNSSGIGTQAFRDLLTGNNNLAVGYQAGYNSGLSMTNYVQTTFLGAAANASANNLVNSTAVGYGAQITADNQMVFGNTSITENVFRGRITQYLPNQNTSVSNTGGALLVLTSGVGNSAYGFQAGRYITTGSYNTPLGTQGLLGITAGNNNVGVGYQSGYNSGVALANVSTSTFIGNNTSSSVDAITNSTALGYQAQVTKSNQMMFGNVNITENVFKGNMIQVAPNFNTRFSNGGAALESLTSGISNTAFGFQALKNDASGSFNTAIGVQAGLDCVTCNNMVYTGYQAGGVSGNRKALSNGTFLGSSTTASADSLTNISAIGFGATVTKSNQMVYGNSNITENLFHGGATIPKTIVNTQTPAGAVTDSLVVKVDSTDEIRRLAPIGTLAVMLNGGTQQNIQGIISPQGIQMFAGATPAAGQVSAATYFAGSALADRFRGVETLTGSAKRWGFGTTGDAESSGDAGSNFAIYSYNDAGTLKATTLAINRATSAITTAGSVNGASATEMGYLSGVTSAIQTQLNAKQATLVSATNIKTINGNSILGSGDLSIGAVTSVSGTTNRITSSGGATPILDISSSYAGQSSITTLGTIGTGIWQGTPIADSYISSASTWNAKQSAITFGTGVETALGVNIGSAGAPVLFNGALGTPSSGVATNLTGTAAGLSIGGSAASLSAASTLPNNTLATTQSAADNSTKVATTAYVDAAAATRASYSEGTWTPAQNGTNPPSSAVGYYTKIGNIVRATFSLFLASNTSSSTFTISDLPFTNSNNVASYGAISLSGTDVGIPIMGIVPTNTATALFSDYSGSAITITQMSGKYISGVITYSTTN